MGSFKRAIQDMLSNRFLTAVTVVTIAFAVLIVGAFTLFFVNANDFMGAWKQGVRIMAYLQADLTQENILGLKGEIGNMTPVNNIRFISREAALTQLREQMKGQASLFDTLDENPLPNAFEIDVSGDFKDIISLETLVAQIGRLPAVESVEYGRQWVERFMDIFNLFRLAAFAMGGLFFMAAVFIVANTIRLVLYSRAEEVVIMRLVGATDGFIKAPFYLEGLILGATGAGIGLLALFAVFSVVSSNTLGNLSTGLFQARFLPPGLMAWIGCGSMLVGWLGCFLSLKQSFKIETAGSEKRPAARNDRPPEKPPGSGIAKIWVLFLLVTGALLAGGPVRVASADPGRSTGRVAVVIVERLNLRPSPAMDTLPIATLQKGDTVTILEESEDWWKVVANGKLGYISRRERFLLVTPPSVSGPAQAEDPGGSQSADIRRLNRRAEELQLRIADQKQAVAAAAKEETEILSRLHAADRSLAASRARLGRLAVEIKALEQRIADAETASSALRGRIQGDSAYIKKRVVALYKLSQIGNLQVLASAQNISDLYRRQTAMQRILEQDQRRLGAYVKQSILLEKLLGDLQASRSQKKTLEAEAEKALQEAAGEKMKKKQLLARVRGEKTLELAALSALKESAKALDRAMTGLGSGPASEARAAKRETRHFSDSKGLLKMPAEGKIIFLFGPYRHPTYDVTNFHGGIDIRTDQGEPVLAVWSGEVVFSDWFKGYGNLIIVNHGDNYHTLYAHLEERFKQKGDPVEAGEVIATVGDSGPVNDSRLHFQIRHRGKPLDPLEWITKG